MKNKQLKLYNKYKYKDNPNIEFIYIGKTNNNNYYWFLYKNKNFYINVNSLNLQGLNSEQIIKDLNLETYIDIYSNKYSNKYIKDYNWYSFNEEDLIHLKPMLKDKLKNIINR